MRSRAFIKLETLVCKYSVYFRDPRRNAIGLTRFLSIDLPLRLMQLCLFSRFACFHMFKTYGCFFIYVPVSPLRLFVPLYRHILKSLLISFITFPGSRRTFEASPLQILPQEFPPRLSLSPSEYFPRAEPLRSFTETFLSLHQENLLRFSRSTLRSGVLSLFTYILAPSVYFVNSFFEDFIFYLYILFSQNEA